MSRTELVGVRFEIYAGDGDPKFFYKKRIVRGVSKPWFPNRIQGQDAYLFEVIKGPDPGRFIALTSHTTTSLVEQMKQADWLSVVVHTFDMPKPGQMVSDRATLGIGMAAVKRVRGFFG